MIAKLVMSPNRAYLALAIAFAQIPLLGGGKDTFHYTSQPQ